MTKEQNFRVKLIAKDAAYRIDEVPISVPGKTGAKGLAKIVNHLLKKEEPINFVFEEQSLSKVLNHTIERYIEKNKLSVEDEVIFKYFVPESKPKSNLKTREAKEWLSSVEVIDNLVFVTSYSGSLEVYENKKTIQLVVEVNLYDQPAKCLSLCDSLDSEYVIVLTGSNNSQVKLCAFIKATREIIELHTLTAHLSAVESIACYHHAEKGELIIASGSWDKNIVIYKFDVSSLKTLIYSELNEGNKPATEEISPHKVISEHTDKVGCLKFVKAKLAGDEEPQIYLISGSNDFTVKIFNSEFESVMNMNCINVPLALDYCETTQTLVTAHVDCCVRVWDLNTKTEKFLINTLRNREAQSFISAVAIKKEYIYSADYSGNIYVWYRTNSVPLHVLKKVQDGKIFDMSFNFEQKVFYSVGADTCIRQHSLEH